MTTMTETVLLIGDGYLMLQTDGESQEVMVYTTCACRFCPGERVCVCYNGVMTRSIPPQINAMSIRRCR